MRLGSLGGAGALACKTSLEGRPAGPRGELARAERKASMHAARNGLLTCPNSRCHTPRLFRQKTKVHAAQTALRDSEAELEALAAEKEVSMPMVPCLIVVVHLCVLCGAEDSEAELEALAAEKEVGGSCIRLCAIGAIGLGN